VAFKRSRKVQFIPGFQGLSIAIVSESCRYMQGRSNVCASVEKVISMDGFGGERKTSEAVIGTVGLTVDSVCFDVAVGEGQ
jgi:hypothetical protein